jgi:quinoprotein relay system zinc metallohydrolase 2
MRRLLFIFVLAPTLFSGTVMAQQELSENVEPAQVEEVAPGMFVRVGRLELASSENLGGIANIGFVVGDTAVAVIDSGGSYRDGLGLLAAIREATDLPIRYVINTHMHPDHILGNSAFVSDSVTFIGHANLPRAIATRGDHYLDANRLLIGAGFAGTEIVLPNLTVEDRLDLDLGGRTLALQTYPTAHTDNDLTVYDRKSQIIWTGDLLFVRHVPVIDGSLQGWIDVIDELSKVPAVAAVPGHGPALVDWPEALMAQRAYLKDLAGELQEMIAAGEGMREAAESAGRSLRDGWVLFDEFNARNATTGYAELEWE